MTKVKVLFLAKAQDGTPCTADRIILNTSDLKNLKAKSGSFMGIIINSQEILCSVWGSKSVTSGTAILNKMWAPYFPSDNKDRTALLSTANVSKIRVQQCSEITLQLHGKIKEEIVLSRNFSVYVKSLLKDVLLPTRGTFGFHIYGTAVLIETRDPRTANMSCAETNSTDCTEGIDDLNRFLLTDDTKIMIAKHTTSSIPSNSTSSSAKAISDLELSPSKESACSHIDFAGYKSQVKQAINIMFAGLGLDKASAAGGAGRPSLTSSSTMATTPLFQPSRGLLICGASGTGKTRLLESLLSVCKCNYVTLPYSLLLSRIEGEAERAIRSTFSEAARRAPCCVVIDNAHLLCSRRSASNATDLQKRIVSCLLTLIDGISPPTSINNSRNNGSSAVHHQQQQAESPRVFILCATSNSSDIDPAFRRFGRIDHEIELGSPTAGERYLILRQLLRDAGVGVAMEEEGRERHEEKRTRLTLQHPTEEVVATSAAAEKEELLDEKGPTLTLKQNALVADKVLHRVAADAHGMVGSDLLKVLKEAFYIHMTTRRNQTAQKSPQEKVEASTINDSSAPPSRNNLNSLSAQVAATSVQIQKAASVGRTAIATRAKEEEEEEEEECSSSSSSMGGGGGFDLAREFTGMSMIDEDDSSDAVSKQDIPLPSPSNVAPPPPPPGVSVVVPTAGPSSDCDLVRMSTLNNNSINSSGSGSGSGNNTVEESDFLEALRRVAPTALREAAVEVPTVRWTDIGGMDSIKQGLIEVAEWPLKYPQLFASLGVNPPRGVLLYGPPGCSKTLLAKALATESSMNFLTVRGPELLSKWLGESEKAVQKLFQRARAAAPSIVFFDEIDALAGRRGDASSGVSDRVLAQLLTELDGIQGAAAQQVIVVAATNRPDMLDDALIRAGRIDRKLYVPPPDSLSRAQIFLIELKRMPLPSPLASQEHIFAAVLKSEQQRSSSSSSNSTFTFAGTGTELAPLNSLTTISAHPSIPPVAEENVIEAAEIDIVRCVELSAGFSGAEVVAVCSEAAVLAMEAQQQYLTQSNLLEAIAAIKPQITADMIEFYEKFAAQTR